MSKTTESPPKAEIPVDFDEWAKRFPGGTTEKAPVDEKTRVPSAAEERRRRLNDLAGTQASELSAPAAARSTLPGEHGAVLEVDRLGSEVERLLKDPAYLGDTSAFAAAADLLDEALRKRATAIADLRGAVEKEKTRRKGVRDEVARLAEGAIGPLESYFGSLPNKSGLERFTKLTKTFEESREAAAWTDEGSPFGKFESAEAEVRKGLRAILNVKEQKEIGDKNRDAIRDLRSLEGEFAKKFVAPEFKVLTAAVKARLKEITDQKDAKPTLIARQLEQFRATREESEKKAQGLLDASSAFDSVRSAIKADNPNLEKRYDALRKAAVEGLKTLPPMETELPSTEKPAEKEGVATLPPPTDLDKLTQLAAQAKELEALNRDIAAIAKRLITLGNSRVGVPSLVKRLEGLVGQSRSSKSRVSPEPPFYAESRLKLEEADLILKQAEGFHSKAAPVFQRAGLLTIPGTPEVDKALPNKLMEKVRISADAGTPDDSVLQELVVKVEAVETAKKEYTDLNKSVNKGLVSAKINGAVIDSALKSLIDGVPGRLSKGGYLGAAEELKRIRGLIDSGEQVAKKARGCQAQLEKIPTGAISKTDRQAYGKKIDEVIRAYVE